MGKRLNLGLTILFQPHQPWRIMRVSYSLFDVLQDYFKQFFESFYSKLVFLFSILLFISVVKGKTIFSFDKFDFPCIHSVLSSHTSSFVM